MDKKYSLISLSLLCFALADVRDGLGPFIGIYLQQHKFSPDEIGFVMTLSGLAGIIFSSILGALTDKTKYKRLLLSVMTLSIAFSSFILLIKPDFISYDVENLPNKYVTSKNVPVLAWTIRSEDCEKKTLKIANNVIFENYIPTNPTNY